MPLSRRAVLRGLVIGAALWSSSTLPIFAQETPLPVPPTLMLHSRHRWLLVDVVEWLVKDGYQGITYRQLEQALLGNFVMPTKPILITIDDLAMDRANKAYDDFVAMKETLVAAGFGGVFGIITRPNRTQDEERWAEVATWQMDNIELATHTSEHTVLDNPDFTAAEYDAEVLNSVQMITAKTGYRVRSLITPYGSGYNRYTNEVNPQVYAAAARANLRFIVGILDGRQPLPLHPTAETLYYVGRTTPVQNGWLRSVKASIANWYVHAEEQAQ
jgi:peptidoglycan/xylan/chitin deacetylase (PgdA/CDA1 family)